MLIKVQAEFQNSKDLVGRPVCGLAFRPWHGCLASLMQKILHSMRKIARVKNQES